MPTKHSGLGSNCGDATAKLAVSNGSAGTALATVVFPASAVNTHFTTGAAARDPYPLFSKYATMEYGCFGSLLKAPNTDESFHGRFPAPWAVPVFPAMGNDLLGYERNNFSPVVE